MKVPSTVLLRDCSGRRFVHDIAAVGKKDEASPLTANRKNACRVIDEVDDVILLR